MPQLFDKLSASHGTPVKAQIASDIVGLMNCATRGGRMKLDDSSPAAQSVLNYGKPPLSPLESTRIDPVKLAAQIRATVAQFEPRLKAETLRVVARTDTDRMARHHLYFDLEGSLVTNGSPYRLRLLLDYLGTSFSAASN